MKIFSHLRPLCILYYLLIVGEAVQSAEKESAAESIREGGFTTVSVEDSLSEIQSLQTKSGTFEKQDLFPETMTNRVQQTAS